MLGRHDPFASKAVARMVENYERQLFDARQLVEISKSLNSTLDYNALLQSILYICMGQLKVLKAGLFARREIDNQNLYLHRSVLGFDMDHSHEYMIPEDHPMLQCLLKDFCCHSHKELLVNCPEAAAMPALTRLAPDLLVPLRAKGKINGLLILGDPINPGSIGERERSYAQDIASLAGIAVHNAFLYEITTTDMMTKLKMRHYFLDVLQDAVTHQRQEQGSLCVMMIDIDHFKQLNDSHGHLCGDEVIRMVCRNILSRIRQTDTAARYGGEEFVVLLPQTRMSEAWNIAERIRESCCNHVLDFHGTPVRTSVSVGIARFDPQVDHSIQDLLERADLAMYRSKSQGRNLTSVLEAESKT